MRVSIFTLATGLNFSAPACKLYGIEFARGTLALGRALRSVRVCAPAHCSHGHLVGPQHGTLCVRVVHIHILGLCGDGVKVRKILSIFVQEMSKLGDFGRMMQVGESDAMYDCMYVWEWGTTHTDPHYSFSSLRLHVYRFAYVCPCYKLLRKVL